MAKGFSFEEALQPTVKGFSFEEALPPEPTLSPEEQVTSQVGQTSGTTAADLAKLTAAGAVKGTLGAPEAVQAGVSATARETAFAPTDILNLIADPRALTNKLVGAVGIPPVFEEKKFVPEKVTEKQKAAVDEVLTKGKIPQLRTLTEFGNRISADLENTISPEMKQALAESQPTGNILKALETGDFSEVSFGSKPTVLGLSGQAAKVFGSAFPAFLTAAVTKKAGPAAAVGFGQAGAEGVDEARNYIDKMTDDELTKKSEYFRNLVALGYTPKDAREMTVNKAGDTAALYQGTVGALGGVFTNKLLHGAFDKTLLSSAKSRLAKIVQGTALGAGEGGLSEMAEGVATDLGIDKAVVREIGVDSFANLVLGALGEGAPGTVRGAIAPTETPSKTSFTFEQAVAPEPTAPIAPAPVAAAPVVPPAAPPTAAPVTPIGAGEFEETPAVVTPEAPVTPAPEAAPVTAVTPTPTEEAKPTEEAPAAPSITPSSAFAEEIASILQKRNPQFAMGTDSENNAETTIFKFARENPEQAFSISKELAADPDLYSNQTGLPPGRIKSIAKQLDRFVTEATKSKAPTPEEMAPKATEVVTEPEISERLKNWLAGKDEYIKSLVDDGISEEYANKVYDGQIKYIKDFDKAVATQDEDLLDKAQKEKDILENKLKGVIERIKAKSKEEKVAANKARQAEKKAKAKESLGTIETEVEGVPVKTTYQREPNGGITITKEKPEGTIVTKIGGNKSKAKAKQTFTPKEEHIEGKKSEPVTSKTIEEAIDKAESNVNYNKIKTAVKNQFDQAIKRAKIQTEKEWAAATVGKDSYVTIDIPGDGKFKVKNNVERLKELQTKIVNAVVPKAAKESSGPSSGAIEAFKGMVDDKDMENAIEYAKLKGLDPKTVKLNPAQRTTVDQYLKNPAEFERQLKASEEMREARQEALRRDQEKRIAERLEADEKREEEARFKAVLDTTIRSTEAQLKADIKSRKISSKDAERMLGVFPNMPEGTVKPYTIKVLRNFVTPKTQPSIELEKKKTATPDYTPEERENAEHHAKDLGGEVAYQKGDLALIRGYSILTGAPTYAVAKGTQRSRVDVGSYTGNLITPSEKAELVKITEQLEKDAQKKHKESPYIKFKDGIALSEDIPADLGGVIKEWKKLLGLKANIYVSTTENAKENKGNFTGPHRVIGSGTLSTTEAGSMRRMPDDSYYVLFEKSTSKSKMLEVIAHELGHVHEREVYSGASPETKKAIRAEFEKWVLSQKGKTAQELVNSLRAKTTAKTAQVPAGTKAENLSSYWTSFGEWYADQVSRWATTTDTPLTVVEKFFKRLGNQMRQFYNNLKNKGYLPNETFKQYLDSLVESKDPVADVGKDADFAPEAMAKKIIPQADKVDALLEKHNRPDTPLHPSGEVKDTILGSYQKSKKIATKMAENPLMTAVNMVGKADRAITYARNKNVWYGSGLEQADFAKYNGQLRNSQGLAAASVAVTNTIHAGHVGTQVMVQGKLMFDPKTQMFRAEKDKNSLANVVRLKHDLEEKLGAQRAANVVNAYFEAKRSRSIVNEYLNRTANYEAAIESGEDLEEASKHLKSIEIAIQKVNMDDEAIDDFIALEKEYPELRQMMDNWTAVNHNLIDVNVFAGVYSKIRGKQLKAIKDYVPWYRIMDDMTDIHMPAGVRGMTNVGQEKKFKAGEVDRDIDDIVDNMIHNVMMMTRNSMRNYANNRIAMEYATRNEKGKIKLYPTEGKDENGVRVNMIANGRRVVVNIPDPLIAEASLGMENIEIPMIDILSFFAQGLRRGITTNPAFQVAQLFMDAPTAAWVSGVKNPAAVWAGTFGSFIRALKPHDPIVDMLKSYGIGGYQSSARTPEKEMKLEIGLIDKSVWARTMKTLDHIGDASDYSQRRAVYKQVLKETGDEMQALIQANNVIDFLKRGSGKGAQFVTRTVSFMNAYAQSIDVLAQALAGGGLKGKTRNQARAQMLKTGLLLAGTTLLYCMAVGADDEYNKLDDQTKIRNIIIPGTKIRLPMHTSASFFFKSIPELIYNKVMKEGTKNQVDWTRLKTALSKAAADSLLGPNMIPTGVKPIAEIALNHNFFTGGTVTPRGMEKLESFRQYNNSTSELGKVLSALTGGVLNPIEMDHLVRGLFGTAGAAVMYGSNLFSGDRVSPQAKDNPLYGSFVLPEVPRGREDLFYDLKERSDKKYETFLDMMKKQHPKEAQEYRAENKGLIAAHGFVTGADADLKRINAEIRRLSDLPADKMSSEEKRARITKFQEQKNRILEKTIEFRLRAEL